MIFILLLTVAFLLQLIGFDDHFLNAAKELLDKDLTISSYYIFFLLVGLLMDLFHYLGRKR